MRLASSAFAEGGTIPRRHTCDGDDLSPPLEWSGVPPGARSFALLCDDPDAPAGTWHHWAACDIPTETHALAEGAGSGGSRPGSMRQAVNDFGRPAYGGPCPPRGHGIHRYHFRLLALSVERLAAQATCQELKREARRHLLAEATLIGLYRRD